MSNDATRPCFFQEYLARLALCSLIWEVTQLPLYTLWETSRAAHIAFAVLHCTVGDLLIGTTSFALAGLAWRAGRAATGKPDIRILVTAIVIAVLYTIASERHNLAVGHWSYSPWMLVVPWLKVGISPLAQWLVVPGAAWWWATWSRDPRRCVVNRP